MQRSVTNMKTKYQTVERLSFLAATLSHFQWRRKPKKDIVTGRCRYLVACHIGLLKYEFPFVSIRALEEGYKAIKLLCFRIFSISTWKDLNYIHVVLFISTLHDCNILVKAWIMIKKLGADIHVFTWYEIKNLNASFGAERNNKTSHF